MNTTRMSDAFAAAFRDTLVTHVDRVRPRRRLMFGTGIAVLAAFGGTAVAAATGMLVIPGGDVITDLSEKQTMTHTGSGGIDLGPAPADATGVAITFTCLSSGQFEFDDGAGAVCGPDDPGGVTTHVLALDSIDDDRVTITTRPTAEWKLSAGYVRADTTMWGVNEAGQSFGAENDAGRPDLIAVVATNGRVGYVHRSELDDADGTTAASAFRSPEDALRWQEEREGMVFRLTVYLSDGVTPVGEFVLG